MLSPSEEDALPPDYLIKDNSGSGGKGLVYAVYSTGAVRQLGEAERNHLEEEYNVPMVANADDPAGTVLLQVSTALRGYTTIRD